MSVVILMRRAFVSTDRVMPVHYEELVLVKSMRQIWLYEPWMVGEEGVGEQQYLYTPASMCLRKQGCRRPGSCYRHTLRSMESSLVDHLELHLVFMYIRRSTSSL